MQKVLIITYYWPPAGGPGVQRWLKFVKYLRDFDIEPVLYIPKNPSYPIQDEGLLSEVPKGLTIYSQTIIEPYGLARLFSKKKTKQISSGLLLDKEQSFLEKSMLWVRGNLFIPDARKFWIKPSIRFLTTIIEKEGIQTIITTGPPHSVHLIGLGLQRRHAVKWLADFRDPWTSIGYHKKLKLAQWAQKRHEQLEHLVLNSADKIVVTSNATKAEFGTITSKPIVVVTNGFDGIPSPNLPLDTKFTLSHIGSLLSGRNPKNLWSSLQGLIEENADFKASFQLQLIGVVSTDVLETLDDFNLTPFVHLKGYLSHEEAVAHQQKSQVLLLVEINSAETKGIVAGKLFEYMAANRPILGFGPKDWEAGKIIAETHTGRVFDYGEIKALKKLLQEWFRQYQQNSLTVIPQGLERYSRRALTSKLAQELQWE